MTVTMDLSGRGARISQRDIRELDAASDALAMAASIIKRDRPRCTDDVVGLLIKANETIERIKAKGAAALARYLERRGVTVPIDDTGAPAEEITSPGELGSIQNDEEE